MIEFLVSLVLFWLIAGLALHVIMLFRNWKFIHNAWRYHSSEIGASAASVVFVLSFFFSVTVWPHVFFRKKQ